MYDLDHMLNGNGSRQHHQDMIKHAQRAKFTRQVKPSVVNNKAISPLRAVFVAIINLVIKSL